MPHATHPGFLFLTWLLSYGLGFLILATLVTLAAALIAMRRGRTRKDPVEFVAPLVLAAALGLSLVGLLTVT